MNYNNELYHHGVLGMKWGVRRYQNANGSLTPAGRQRLKTYKEKHSEYARSVGAERANKYRTLSSSYKQIADKAKMSGDTKKYQSAKNKSMQFDAAAKTSADITRKQLDKIKKMSYQDMLSEQRKTTAKKATYAATTVLLNVATLPVAKIPVIIPIPDGQAIAYNNRLKNL